MANITKLKSGKWRVQIRSHYKYISKTFLKKSNASAWAKEIEYQLDRDQYEDYNLDLNFHFIFRQVYL